MLENALYFALGFLLCAILILMMAPAIWRRAVALTKSRIESAVPLTMNEIQADKDQMRAEYAMTIRKLEIDLKKQKDTGAEQLIEVNKRRDEVMDLKADIEERNKNIEELEQTSEAQLEALATREKQLAKTADTLSRSDEKLKETRAALADLTSRYDEIIDDYDSQKVEVVARESRFENIQSDARDARKMVQAKDIEINALRAELKISNQTLVLDKEKSKDLTAKIEQLQGRNADLEDRLERRENDISRMRDQSGTGAVSSDTALLDEIADLRNQLKRVSTERDSFKLEAEKPSTVDAVQTTEQSGRDYELIREHIADLAARVTAMTIESEGTASPINAALSKRKKPASKALRESSGTALADNTQNARSLADRVRSLQ